MVIKYEKVYQSALFFLALCCVQSAAASRSAQEYLTAADAIRNPSEAYKMRLKVTAEDSEQVLDVYLKGTDKTLIATRSPSRDVGRNMLMLDRDFYAYVPNLKRSVRLSLAQKLMGQVANGDIARTRWANDYKAEFENGAPAGEVQLLLEGNKPNLTYQKIRAWLDAKNSRPLRADYLSIDGKSILKHAFFEEYKTLSGKERPSRIRIKDAGGKASTIQIQSMETATLADSFFTERNMETVR